MPKIRPETPQLIVFVDLTRFAAQSQRVDDVEIADSLDAFYEQVGASVQGAGGRVVKCLGDAVLIAFDEAHVDRGVESLLSLKTPSMKRWPSAGGSVVSSSRHTSGR